MDEATVSRGGAEQQIGTAVLDPAEWRIADLGRGPPIVTVVIDTEAEFDWSGPFHRNLTGVANVQRLEPVQRLFERLGVKPTYMVDYAVSTQAEAYGPLREFLAAEQCEIGAHLQPWETPPFEEDTTEANSFLGNLTIDLQRRKLIQLTDIVEETFGVKARAYRAGRSGVGLTTASLLAEMGYFIDLSVLPVTDLRDMHGPDFSRCPIRPYWFGPAHSLLEIPMTVAVTGLLGTIVPGAYACIAARRFQRLHLPGLMARLGLLERISLTPEGVTFAEMRRLTDVLIRRGHRSFTLSFHSPSLMPGNTPYVRNAVELDAFIGRIRAYLEYFLGELKGIAMTPMQLREMALKFRIAAPVSNRSETCTVRI